jgi:Tfp pilus assembly protein PilV
MALYVFVTMRTFLATLRFKRRPPRPSRQPLIRPARRPKTVRFPQVRASIASTRSESGISLIEVLISSLIVAVVAIGTFTAFDTAGRASADQRAHAQAGQLARQDQERMRSLTSTELLNFAVPARFEAENGLCLKKELSGKYKYYPKENKENLPFCEAETPFAAQEYTGNVFTVSSSASLVEAAHNSLACESAGTGGTTSGTYLKTTSSVTWTTLAKTTRPPVTQSSIVTNGSTGLLVKVFNQNHQPLAGATVIVKGSKSSSTQTTPTAGCVLVTGLTDTTVKVAASKLTYVDRAAKSPPAEQTVEISPTAAATVEFVIAEPGSIEAEFISENAAKVMEKAKSDTFYARQGSVTPPPENFVDGTNGTPVETEILKPVFPFAKPATPHEAEPYTVYAGDCAANNPETVNPEVHLEKNNLALVTPGGPPAPVKIEVPTVNLTVFEGVAGTPLKPVEGGGETSAYITNPACSGATAQNATVSNTHKVALTASATEALRGHLSPKYLPYATELQLCVVAKLATGKYTHNVFTIANTLKKGILEGASELKFYMKTAGTNLKSSTTKGALTCP